MLTIISGPARSGKTRMLLEKMKNAPGTGLVLLTPEQGSHEAERALAAYCGAEVNLRAEVLSFTRLCSRVFTELGGSADVVPDRGSKLMLMSLAVASVAPKLQIYASRERRADFLESLLDTREELARCMADVSRLFELAGAAPGETGRKLSDLALICGAYDALLAQRLPDPRERLERLGEMMDKSSVGLGGFFVDGFTDFTALELGVMDALLRRGGDVTVTLCRDGSEDVHFAAANMTLRRLQAMAGQRGVAVRLLAADYVDESRAPELETLCENLFNYKALAPVGETGAITAVAADSVFSECELAAARVLAWMKAEPGLRWGDIAVAARDFEKYESIAESVFALYGIPVFIDRHEEVSRGGIFALALSALETVLGSWRREDVFRYLKTGLCGLEPEELGELENYCAAWSIRGESAWRREWSMDPEGFTGGEREPDRERLGAINSLRERAGAPLLKLAAALRGCESAVDFAAALYDHFEALGLRESLAERAGELRRAGDSAGADALVRSWELMVSALEELAASLGCAPVTAEEAARLFALVAENVSSGSIPTSLDSVSLGELTRLRGRRVRRLVVLGADESGLPLISGESGVFSREERQLLSELGLELSSLPDEELCREFSAIYLALSTASEAVYLSWTADSPPSFVVNRALALTGGRAVSGASLHAWAASMASEPLFRLALSGDASPEAEAARSLAVELWGGRFERAREAVNAPRGSLGERSVRELYGRDFHLTASRAEKFSVCRFAYFMRFGLHAKKRATSALDAPELGSFVHYVLEGTVRQVREMGGFRAVSAEEAAKAAEGQVRKYINDVLHGFEGKSSRFVYLFTRLRDGVLRIARDVAEEFAVSDFEPLDFELSFERGGDLPPVRIDCGGMRMYIEGKVDRVDGWLHGDTLYLRVADYKTGKTSFSLSDVWYGKGIQMLIYLFALQAEGGKRYGRDIRPAGVLYSPARDVLLPLPRGSSDEEIAAARRKLLRRSGLVLNEPEVIEAMENGDSPSRIPVTFKKGEASGSLASAEQLGRLAEFVEKTLEEMGREVRAGSIAANPLKNAAEDPCAYCEFAAACDFRDGVDKARIKAKLSDREFWERV